MKKSWFKLKGLILVMLLGIASSSNGQYTIDVTSVTDNPTSPQSGQLRWAINQAEAHANTTGDDVFIDFNAPGLCQALDAFPPVTLTDGSITFRKKSTATVDQGIDVNFLSGSTYSSILKFENNTTSTIPAIKISNLNFINYGHYDYMIYFDEASSSVVENCNFNNTTPSFVSSDGIASIMCFGYFADHEVIIRDCDFEGHRTTSVYQHLLITRTTKAEVSGCTFDMSLWNSSSHWIKGISVQLEKPNTEINIFNNTFIGAAGMQTEGIYSFPEYDPSTLVIYNNTFTNGWMGFRISRLYTDVNNASLSNIDINNNTFNGLEYAAMYIQAPKPYFKVRNNNFNSNYKDIIITHNNGQNTNLDISEFSIVESNAIGYTTTNTGNLFNSFAGSDASIEYYWYGSDRIIKGIIAGLDLKGRVHCGTFPTTTTSVIIHDNKIVSNGTADQPIVLTNAANAQNPAPVITSAQVNTSLSTLAINYTISGLNVTDQPKVVVDFYLSNSNGDFVSYLGNSGGINYAVANGNHSVVFSAGSVTSSSRIAATVTTSPSGMPTNVYGTSEPFYFSNITPSIHSYNTPCNAINLTCEDNSIQYTGIVAPSEIWYTYTSAGTIPPSSCAAYLNITATGKITLIEVYNETCSTAGTGTPFYTTGPISVLSYNLHHLQLPAGTLYIRVVFGPLGSPGNWQYSITADAQNDPGCTDCPYIPCEDCLGSFIPEGNKGYIISAWVREDGAPASQTEMDKPFIEVNFPSVSGSPLEFRAEGAVIDGWQKIYGKFVVPLVATDIQITLDCDAGDCLFDDVRVFPEAGMMKSYVYDPVTLRFVAELDEQNYASFYEYDEEGKLTTVKKETERGVMTIKESRNKIIKKP